MRMINNALLSVTNNFRIKYIYIGTIVQLVIQCVQERNSTSRSSAFHAVTDSNK